MPLLKPQKWFKTLFKRCFSLLGYELKRKCDHKPIDLRTSGNHPAQLLYYSSAHPILINLPINKGRGFRTLPLDDPKQHPFVLASCAMLRSGSQEKTILEVLEHYYKLVQPATAAEWLGLEIDDKCLLHQELPSALSMPWDRRTPVDWKEAREAFALGENRAQGVDLSIDNGWHFWGPVSRRKLQVESTRLEKLIHSIQQNGIQRHDGHDGDIRAVVLRSNTGDWCWQVAGGEHRVAVLSALGYTSVPVRVTQVVQREDVNAWPGVIEGVFSEHAALRTFDRIMDGQIPMQVNNWKSPSKTKITEEDYLLQ